MEKYYIKLTTVCNTEESVSYYYGTKHTREYGTIRDFWDELLEDVKLYSNRKTAEKMANTILEEHTKGYPWLKFSVEVLPYQN